MPHPGQPTGELTNIPRSAVMQAVGQLGSWLQAAAEQLDQVGVTVPGLGRITAKDITLGDVGQVLENISYGFGPVRGGDPAAGDLSAIPQLRPEALELLNLTILPSFGSAAARLARGAPRATAAAAGAAALAPGEAEGMGSRRMVERLARGIAEEGAGGAGQAVGAAEMQARTMRLGERIYRVATPGHVDFGAIDPDIANRIGRQSGPIRLPEGSDQFGALHLERDERAVALRRFGFPTAESFVSFVAAGMDEIRAAGGTRLMLVREVVDRNDRRAALVVELQPSAAGDGYEVVTGGILRSGYVAGKKLLWERERAPRRPEPDATPSLRADPQNSGQASPSAEGQSKPNVAPRAPGDNGDVE